MSDDLVSIGGKVLQTYDIPTDKLRPMTADDYADMKAELDRFRSVFIKVRGAVDGWKAEHAEYYPTQSPWKDGVPK